MPVFSLVINFGFTVVYL